MSAATTAPTVTRIAEPAGEAPPVVATVVTAAAAPSLAAPRPATPRSPHTPTHVPATTAYDPPGGRPDPTPTCPKTRPRRGPRLSRAQLVCWQLALAAPLAAYACAHGHVTARVIIAGCAAAVLLAATAGRRRGRWLYRWAWLAVTFGSRARTRTIRTDRLLATLAPGTQLVPLEVGDDTAAAVRARAGLATVLLLDGACLPPAASLVPTERDVRYAVQTIEHRVPDEPPSGWVVLQARPDAYCPDVVADLANATRRLLRRLERAGTPAVVAGVPEVERMVRTLVGADTPIRVVERWAEVQVGAVVHVVAEVFGVVPRVPAPITVARLATSPEQVSTTVCVHAAAADHAVKLLAAIPGATVAHGRQLPGFRALLPTGAALDIG